MIVDTHIHLDDARYDEDLASVIERAKQNGVEKFIVPGADPATLPKAVAIAERFQNVYFAVGVHPYDIKRYDRKILEDFITHPKCVAVGECGLDYYRLPEDTSQHAAIKQAQQEVFADHVALAKRYEKPLIVHIREASLDAKNVLIRNRADSVGGVLHCFNANESLLELADFGFYFGIGGVITFKNAKKLVRVLPKIPLERLLVETDGPYLTPEPHRGTRNEPAYTVFVVQKIAELLQTPQETIEETTTRNAQTLFFRSNR